EPGWWPFIWPFFFGATLVDTGGAPTSRALDRPDDPWIDTIQLHRRDAEDAERTVPNSSLRPLRLCGESFPSNAISAAKALIDAPEVIAAYDWVQSYPRAFGLDKLNNFRSTFGSYDSAQNAFIDNKVSMVLQGPWLANMINLYNKDLDYAVAP